MGNKLINIFKHKNKIENHLFDYEEALLKHNLTFSSYVMKWLSQFNLKILHTLDKDNVTGAIDFVVIDDYSPTDSRSYCFKSLCVRTFEVNTEVIEEFCEAAKEFGGKPVIITNNNISGNAAILANTLGIEIINYSMLRGINDFILDCKNIKIKENSEMFTNRLTYYIKQTLQGAEV